MKIVTWNCRGAFRKKYHFIEKQNADLYIIQEVEHPDKWTTGKKDELLILDSSKYIYRAFAGDAKGILVYSHNYPIIAEQIPDFNIRYFIPFTCNQHHFIGIWTKDHYVSDIHTYCLANEKLLTDRLFIGDFNANLNFDTKKVHRAYRGMLPLNAWMKKNNLVSCYHTKYNEALGEEKKSTFWQMRKSRKKYYYIDYCYIPNYLNFEFKILDTITDLAIKNSELSTDHYPLLLEIT